MNRIFVREQTEELYRLKQNKLKIGIMGMSKGAGTSFISSSLAKHLSKEKDKSIAFVEVNMEISKNHYIYDSLGMDKRFAGRVFHDFYTQTKEGRPIGGLANLDEKINWALRIPPMPNQSIKEIKMEPIEICRIINNIVADIIICDVTYTSDVEEVIREMDIILFIIDPLPSKLISGYSLLCEMKNRELKGQKVLWIINKYNEGVNKRELSSFIKIKNYFTIPMIQQEFFYLAEYNCRIPYTVKSIVEDLLEPLEKIGSKIEI